MIANKLKQIRNYLAEHNIDVFIATASVSRRYLSGFTGSAGIIWISMERQALITDFRYVTQATEQCPDWEIIKHDGLLSKLEELVKRENIKRVAIEGDYLTVNELSEWKHKLNVEFVATKDIVEDLRIVKTEDELNKIRKAVEIGEQSLATTLLRVSVGVSEKEIALELEFAMRKLGASGNSFNPIVASGPNSALPHAQPGDRTLRNGDFVVMDFGCVFNGYCSDMTRTLVVGEPTTKHLNIYNLVLQAQLTGLKALSTGKTGAQVDYAARQVIDNAGYGEYFGHGLGHGLGLMVHENPRLSKIGKRPLKPGMVVTVEPGIYLPGFGGVRIEDLVAIYEDEIDIMTSYSKELIIIE